MTPKHPYHHWQTASDLIDQCIDIALNFAQSGHPGGSRSKVHVMVATLLSGAMRWDIRHPEKRFGDKFVLGAGHTNPLIYATLAVFNEALRRKYKETGDKKYLNPKGDGFTLHYEDLLTLRRRGGLPGHAEMEGKTLFLKCNTGASGHGEPVAVGEAFALKYAGMSDVKVFNLEGEGGLTPGVVQEAKNSAYGLGLGNLFFLIDWNDYGIDDRPYSDVVYGEPKDWFESCGWKVAGTEKGDNFESIMGAYEELLNDTSDKPKALWVKTRKGRGYGKFDNASHGAPHKYNSPEFWTTKKEFADKYEVDFKHIDQGATGDFETDKKVMTETLETVMSVFDEKPEFLDYLAERLLELGESIPTENENTKVFDKNPLDDPALFDYKNYPKELFKAPGEKAPNRAGLGAFGSWINTYCQKKYNRPFLIASSADLAGSTNIAGCADGWCGYDDFGMYDRKKNLKGTLLPQPITEFANAGIMTGISATNFSQKPFDEFNGFYTASSTYGSFSYLKYGIMRIYSQMVQDSQIKLGKTIWVAGHSGPETAEDSRTHFGIFSPEVTQLFPKGHVINLHPWEYNEVPVMLAAAMQTDVPIIALHLTRPPVTIPDREALGMPSYFEAAKGAYILKDYDSSRPKEGVVMVRGTKVVDELLQILDRIKKEGPNVKIVAVLSNSLFRNQTQEYQDSVISPTEWLDAMIITNTSMHQMSRWVQHPIVKKYSLSPDWDNQWRSGGKLDEVMDEARLSAKWQWDGIVKFAEDREKRLVEIRAGIPE